MERTNLIKILNGDIDLIDHVNVRDVALFGVHVTIYPRDVRKMLLHFLNGQITSVDLNKWAQFITLRAEYCCPHWEIDKIADYYEDMMYVIQCLSTPEIDGEINESQVKQYLSELEKYNHEMKPFLS